MQRAIQRFSLVVLGLALPLADAEPIQIGYFEGKRFSSYIKTFEQMHGDLKASNTPVAFPAQDACYTTDGKPASRALWPEQARQLLARQDLDLIFAAGTDASREILKAANCFPPTNPDCDLPTPVVSCCVSDAIRSQLVLGPTDSGVENFTVRIVPERYTRMFRIFHDEVGFTKLGILYAEGPDGLQLANVEDARTVARERGFALELAKLPKNAEITRELCQNTLQSLVDQGIDAFYMTVFTCFEWGNPAYDPMQFQTFLKNQKIPVLARQGSKDVKAGALMGFSTVDFSSRGRFMTDRVLDVVAGKKPRDLPMVDPSPPKVALNMTTAKALGITPSPALLEMASEVYTGQQAPNNAKAMFVSPCELPRPQGLSMH